MTEFLYLHQEVQMKISSGPYFLVAILSFFLLSGFTCSKHAPEKAPEIISSKSQENGAVPQDQMTDQTTSGDGTTTTK